MLLFCLSLQVHLLLLHALVQYCDALVVLLIPDERILLYIGDLRLLIGIVAWLIGVGMGAIFPSSPIRRSVVCRVWSCASAEQYSGAGESCSEPFFHKNKLNIRSERQS